MSKLPRSDLPMRARTPTAGLASLRVRAGVDLLASGRLAEALACFDDAIRIEATLASAHLNRGIALDQMGWPREAEAAYRHSIALAPADAEAHRRLGLVLLLQERRSEAAASFRRAAAQSGKSTAGSLAKAHALMAERKPEKLVKLLRQVIATDPATAAPYNLLGQVLAEQGDAGGAEEAFRHLLARNPSAVGRYYDLVRIRRLGSADASLLDDMLQSAKRSDLHPLARVMLCLAIAKAYDDFGSPEQSMDFLLQANRLKGAIRPLDRDLFQARVQGQIDHFTADRLDRYRARGADAHRIIVIVGMPRSGTTLIESILARHRAVAAGQELAFWGQCGPALFVSQTEDVPQSRLAQLGRDYVEVLRAIDPVRRVTDKKPDNFVWAGLIHAVFPNARIVHCVRDPVDTCLSIMRNFFAPRPDFSTEPTDLAFYFRHYVSIMRHWHAVLPEDRLLDIDYETLTTSPEAEIRRLLEFCDLEWEDDCLHPERGTREITTASLWQARQPIFRSSVGNAASYEAWLGDLTALRSLSPRPGSTGDPHNHRKAEGSQ